MLKILSIKTPILITILPIYDQTLNVNIVHVWFYIKNLKISQLAKFHSQVHSEKKSIQKVFLKIEKQLITPKNNTF